MSRSVFSAVGLVLMLGVASPTIAGDVVKHSGTIVAFDEKTDTIVLAEVGPWQVRDGATVVTKRRITLTPDTELAIVFRAEEPASGFAGEYVEAPLERAGVYVEDYVTVECRHEGGRMIALKIIVVDLPGADYREEGGS